MQFVTWIEMKHSYVLLWLYSV